MSTWWVVPAALAGALLGFFVASILAARRIADAEDRALRARTGAIPRRVS